MLLEKQARELAQATNQNQSFLQSVSSKLSQELGLQSPEASAAAAASVQDAHEKIAALANDHTVMAHMLALLEAKHALAAN